MRAVGVLLEAIELTVEEDPLEVAWVALLENTNRRLDLAAALLAQGAHLASIEADAVEAQKEAVLSVLPASSSLLLGQNLARIAWTQIHILLRAALSVAAFAMWATAGLAVLEHVSRVSQASTRMKLVRLNACRAPNSQARDRPV